MHTSGDILGTYEYKSLGSRSRYIKINTEIQDRTRRAIQLIMNLPAFIFYMLIDPNPNKGKEGKRLF